jgi:hypothetical protein
MNNSQSVCKRRKRASAPLPRCSPDQDATSANLQERPYAMMQWRRPTWKNRLKWSCSRKSSRCACHTLHVSVHDLPSSQQPQIALLARTTRGLSMAHRLTFVPYLAGLRHATRSTDIAYTIVPLMFVLTRPNCGTLSLHTCRGRSFLSLRTVWLQMFSV